MNDAPAPLRDPPRAIRFPTKAEFAKWLESKPGDATVGFATRLACCPLATFLRSRGAPAPYVRPDITARQSFWRSSNNFHDGGSLPEWANSFAREIDRRPRLHDEVVASEALRVLRLSGADQ